MGFDIFALIWGASFLVKLVMVVLVILSATSWAIIVFKYRELNGADEDSEAFLEVFTRAVEERLGGENGHVGSMLSGGMDSGSWRTASPTRCGTTSELSLVTACCCEVPTRR